MTGVSYGGGAGILNAALMCCSVDSAGAKELAVLAVSLPGNMALVENGIVSMCSRRECIGKT